MIANRITNKIYLLQVKLYPYETLWKNISETSFTSCCPINGPPVITDNMQRKVIFLHIVVNDSCREITTSYSYPYIALYNLIT